MRTITILVGLLFCASALASKHQQPKPTPRQKFGRVAEKGFHKIYPLQQRLPARKNWRSKDSAVVGPNGQKLKTSSEFNAKKRKEYPSSTIRLAGEKGYMDLMIGAQEIAIKVKTEKGSIISSFKPSAIKSGHHIPRIVMYAGEQRGENVGPMRGIAHRKYVIGKGLKYHRADGVMKGLLPYLKEVLATLPKSDKVMVPVLRAAIREISKTK